ncbi:MAG: WD40 repeat domain-containing protein, partial [Gemmataceae bacterium]|nr:WD40 repeat domain-containing protein [Gemmataceae bacterium]
MRHADRVNALAYGADGKLASASRDYTVKIWDLGNGREVVTYRGHADQTDDPTKGTPAMPSTNPLGATDVAFHPTEKVVASSSGNQVHLWHPETGKQIKVLLNLGKTDKPIKSVGFSPDGALLAVGSDDGVLRVLESDTGKAVYTSPSRNARIERVTFSPNGKLVAVGDSNSQVAVYAVQNKGNALAMSVRVSEFGVIAGVAFSPDSGSVFTAGEDGKARLTAGPNPDGTGATNTATKLREFTGHDKGITGLALTADGKVMATSGVDKTVRVWDVVGNRQLRSFQGHMDEATAVAVRADGRQVASGSKDGAIRVWDLNATDDHRALLDAKESLWAVAVSPDGKRVAAGGADKKIRVYDPDTGKLEATLDAGAAMTSLCFLSNDRLAAAGGDKAVRVWDLDARKVAKELPGHTLAVLALAATPDGKLLVSGSADATVRGFDPQAGKELWKWASRKAACAVAVRKGGKHVAVGLADGTLAIVDVGGATPKELSSQGAHTAGTTGVAYSPDGNRLATVGGDGALRVWATTDGGALTQVVKFDGPATPTTALGFSPLSSVAFSADGRFVAAGGADAVVRVWDVQTKSEVRGLRGHTDWVTSVAIAPDGRFVATVAAEKDNALRVFDLPPLEATSAAGGHLLSVNAVAVSPNGKRIVTASTDQTMKVWDIATGREVATLVGNADTPLAVAFLSDNALVMGGQLPTRDAGRLHFWTVAPPRAAADAVATGEVYTVVPTADGSKVGVWAARASTGKVKNNVYELYDAKGKLLQPTVPDRARNVVSATFTPDLSWAVAGDETGTLRIFDMTNGERVKGDWPLFQRGFADLGITADKKLLVGADDEGLVKVAGVAERDVIADGKPHKAGVRALLVSPTGQTFLTISPDRELKVWSLTQFKDKKLVELRAWALPVSVNGAAYTPDGKAVVTANAD